MRIGIDARALSGRMTGDRTYWRGLIGGLAKLGPENDYFLYLQQPLEGEPLSGLGENFRWRMLPKPANSAAWMLKAFPDALRADQIDVAHTQYNIPLLGAPCPVVTTVHDVTFALFPELFLPRDRFLLNRCMPLSLRRAAHIIADSESTRRDILTLYGSFVSPEKVTSILLAADASFRNWPHGQETSYRMVNTGYNLDGRPYFLAVGVLQPRKNLAMLLDAFALVKSAESALPHWLLIAGKRGWKNEELDRKLACLPPIVRESILFTGYVSDEDLPPLYAGADAFCYPSLYEGFGLPLLEAMACGCPVLSSDTSSLPEVVGDAGLLLPPNDSRLWADALLRLTADKALPSRLRTQGPAQANRFTWEKTAQETLRVYQATARHVKTRKKPMTTSPALSPDFVKILACPADDNRPPLRLQNDTLVCDQCGRIYPIRDGIPILLPEEAAWPENPEKKEGA